MIMSYNYVGWHAIIPMLSTRCQPREDIIGPNNFWFMLGLYLILSLCLKIKGEQLCCCQRVSRVG